MGMGRIDDVVGVSESIGSWSEELEGVSTGGMGRH